MSSPIINVDNIISNNGNTKTIHKTTHKQWKLFAVAIHVR